MKKIIIILLYFFMIVFLYSQDTDTDNIFIFLEEKIEGKKTGNYAYMELVIYKKHNTNTIKYILTQLWIRNDFNRMARIFLTQSTSNDIFNEQVIKNIKWLPGKRLECKYSIYEGQEVSLIIERIGRKINDWKVYAIGNYKSCEACESKKWEFVGKKKIKLKTKELSVYEAFE